MDGKLSGVASQVGVTLSIKIQNTAGSDELAGYMLGSLF